MVVSKDVSEKILELLKQPNTFVVTDKTVFLLYENLFDKKNTHIIAPGENQKNLSTVQSICEFLLKNGANRNSTLVAVGGGVVGDITGFAASIFMRGIDWVSVPTTLLSLCDSSIGGKTGVDLGKAKNIIGTFHFPKEIILSSHFIKSLDEREFLCGVGEVLKTACLSGEIFKFFVKNEQAMYKRDEEVLRQLVSLCANHKAQVVKKDPFEKTGLRKTLNYGHTVGHAFEAADNHKLSHGEYILHGIRIENKINQDILDKDFFIQAEALISRALNGKKTKFDMDAAVQYALADKKNKDGKIAILAIPKVGEYKEVFLTKEEFAQRLKAVL